MSSIVVNPDQIMRQLRDVQNAAAPLARAGSPGGYSGRSAAAEELLRLCSRLLACAQAYYGLLQSDVGKTEVLLEQLTSEDQKIGMGFLNE